MDSNFPNTSNEFRIVQYLKMIPVDDPREFRPALQLSKYTSEQWYINNLLFFVDALSIVL